MRHGICLSGLLGIHLSLRKLVVFLDIHSLILVRFILDLIMLYFGVICVILLIVKLIRALIIHVILNLTLYYPGMTLMFVLTLPDSSIPLAHYMGLEVGEPFEVGARFIFTNVCFQSEDTFNEVYDLVKTPLEELRDVFMHEDFPSLDCNIVLPNPLDHSHAFPFRSLPSPSSGYYIDTPIENRMTFYAIMISDMRITCSACLVGMLIILCPRVTLVSIMPPLTHISCT